MNESLIRRLQKAEGPDRTLDADIFQLLGGKRWDQAYNDAQMPSGCPHDKAVEGARWRAPYYTTSIDEALTLLPPWSWRIGNLPSGRAFVDLGTQKSMQCIEGATPAIAICIAALRAKEGG